MSIIEFSTDYLDSLTSQALASPRKRQHRNVHANYADPVQRLYNAIEPDSYIRPHQHGLVPRSEMMIAVRGWMVLVVFDDMGKITACHPFSVNQPGTAVGVEIPAYCWHTVVALESGSILLEVKAGPFDPAMPKEMAPWAPEEGSEMGRSYHVALRSHAESSCRNKG